MIDTERSEKMSNLTKTAIRTALIKLLNENPINRITVKDIVRECGINRNTFYYHYEDLPSLLEEIINNEADRIIGQYTELGSMEECFDFIIGFAMENRKVVLHIHNSANREIYERYLWRVCEHAVTSFVNRTLSEDVVSDEDRKIIIKHYKCLCYGQAMDWLDSGMRNDVKADFHRFCELKREFGDPVVNQKI